MRSSWATSSTSARPQLLDALERGGHLVELVRHLRAAPRRAAREPGRPGRQPATSRVPSGQARQRPQHAPREPPGHEPAQDDARHRADDDDAADVLVRHRIGLGRGPTPSISRWVICSVLNQLHRRDDDAGRHDRERQHGKHEPGAERPHQARLRLQALDRLQRTDIPTLRTVPMNRGATASIAELPPQAPEMDVHGAIDDAGIVVAMERVDQLVAA